MLPFAKGLGLLFGQEFNYRETSRLARLSKQAKLHYSQAMVENDES